MIAELRKRHTELNGKVIVPGLPANTKEEQYLIDHMLKIIEAVGAAAGGVKELLRRVADHRPAGTHETAAELSGDHHGIPLIYYESYKCLPHAYL